MFTTLLYFIISCFIMSHLTGSADSIHVKAPRTNKQQIQSNNYPISFKPLIPAGHFRKHLETSDEYADLYCNVEQLIRQNYEWAVSHPEEINTRRQSEYLYQLFHPVVSYPQQQWVQPQGGIMGKLGGLLGQQNSYIESASGNLCLAGSKISIPVANFKFKVVETVVDKIREAGYIVKYSVTETGNPKEVSNVEMGESITAISISLD